MIHKILQYWLLPSVVISRFVGTAIARPAHRRLATVLMAAAITALFISISTPVEAAPKEPTTFAAVPLSTPAPGRMCKPQEFGRMATLSNGKKVRCIRVNPFAFGWVYVRK